MVLAFVIYAVICIAIVLAHTAWNLREYKKVIDDEFKQLHSSEGERAGRKWRDYKGE